MFNVYDVVNDTRIRRPAAMPVPTDLRQLSVEDIEHGVHCMTDEERYGQLDPFAVFATVMNAR